MGSEMEIKVDLRKRDLSLLFKLYERIMVEYLWEEGAEPTGSGKLFRMVNERLPGDQPMSRASIIFAANRMVEKFGVWGCTDATGKGGHHKLYFVRLSEAEMWKALAKTFLEKVVNASELDLEELLGDLVPGVPR